MAWRAAPGGHRDRHALGASSAALENRIEREREAAAGVVAGGHFFGASSLY
jgi:hypothetical protein